jgi:pimeloyl-ACP methyl ester carboxylesterase
MSIAHVNGIDIYFEEHGDTGAEPVLMIMGYGGNGLVWAPQLRALAPCYRVITYDNRGSGRSSQPPGPYTIPQMAGDAAALLDHLGIDAAHVVGASMGGMIAQELALRHPSRVRSLALLCTTPGGPNAAAHRAIIERGAELDTMESVQASLTPERARALLLDAFTPEYIDAPNEDFAAYLAPALQFPSTLDGLKGQFHAIAGHDTWDRLPSITAPALVMTGDADPLVDPRNSHILAQRIPGAALRIFPRLRHGFHAEAADAVNDALLRFIDAHAAVPAPGP